MSYRSEAGSDVNIDVVFEIPCLEELGLEEIIATQEVRYLD